MSLRSHLLPALLVALLAACTSAPVDPAATSKIKSVSITKVYFPEYSYFGRDGEAAAKSLGVAASAYAFGVFGMVAGEVAKSKSEQPYRDAIRMALSGKGPEFAEVVDQNIVQLLQSRGIRTTLVAAPPKLADNSGYDFGNSDSSEDYTLELFPYSIGFAYGKETSTPYVDLRWRLLRRYPNGKLIEAYRGSVYYSDPQLTLAPNGVLLPVKPEYRFAGHMTSLSSHADRPAVAMRELAKSVADTVIERAFPQAK
jgi:hypothetical protein